MESVAQEWAGVLKVVKVNVDDERQLASQFNITATPTFILYRRGLMLGDTSGALPREQLMAWIYSLVR